MNTSFIPGPLDVSQAMESAITKTATFAGTTYDLLEGFAPGGIGLCVAAVLEVTALDLSSGNETYTAQLMESDDDATYTACGPAISITAIGNLSVPGWLSKRYAKVALTLAGTTPSITYSATLARAGCCAG